MVDYFLGIRGAVWIWNGAWSDPQIRYKGHILNAWDVQEGVESMYDDYVSDGYIKPCKGGWKEWGAKNPKSVKALMDEYIWAMDEANPKKKAVRKAKTPVQELNQAFSEGKKKIRM